MRRCGVQRAERRGAQRAQGGTSGPSAETLASSGAVRSGTDGRGARRAWKQRLAAACAGGVTARTQRRGSDAGWGSYPMCPCPWPHRLASCSGLPPSCCLRPWRRPLLSERTVLAATPGLSSAARRPCRAPAGSPPAPAAAWLLAAAAGPAVRSSHHRCIRSWCGCWRSARVTQWRSGCAGQATDRWLCRLHRLQPARAVPNSPRGQWSGPCPCPSLLAGSRAICRLRRTASHAAPRQGGAAPRGWLALVCQ